MSRPSQQSLRKILHSSSNGCDCSSASVASAASLERIAKGDVFQVKFDKTCRGGMGLALVEHDGTIIVESVRPGCAIDQTNSRSSRDQQILPGDAISGVNGVRDITSVISVCQGVGAFTFDIIRGSHGLGRFLQPSFDEFSAAEGDSSSSGVQAEPDQQTNAERLQQLSRLQEEQSSQRLEDRRRLSECTGQQDLQKLFAERLAKSKRNLS